jgi:hypothetical protein
MREIRAYGSVRGARSNARPYRDSGMLVRPAVGTLHRGSAALRPHAELRWIAIAVHLYETVAKENGDGESDGRAKAGFARPSALAFPSGTVVDAHLSGASRQVAPEGQRQRTVDRGGLHWRQQAHDGRCRAKPVQQARPECPRGGPRATQRKKSLSPPDSSCTRTGIQTILLLNANRALHRRPRLPIPPRGWCAPRPPPRRRGARRHCSRHHPRLYPAAPCRVANRLRLRRRARTRSPRAQPVASSAPATRPVHLSRSAGLGCEADQGARKAGG